MTVRGAVGDSTRTAKTTRVLVAFQPSIGGCHDSRLLTLGDFAERSRIGR